MLVLSQYFKKEVVELEKVQRKAAKMMKKVFKEEILKGQDSPTWREARQ